MAEVELNKSFIDKLYFYTLDCDINKKNKPLNFITKYTPVQITTFKSEEKQLIKVDKYGNHSTFGVTSIAPYAKSTNVWSINGNNNVSFNNEPLISGGAFTIMFVYKTTTIVNHNEEFVYFRDDANIVYPEDISIKRWGTTDGITIQLGGVMYHYTGIDLNFNITHNFIFVVVPNVGVKFYKNGNEIGVNWLYPANSQLGDIPAKKYNIQNIGGTGTKVGGLLGNFRFYNRALSSDEISTIGSTYNDLVPFNIRPIFFKGEENQLIKVDKYENHSTFGVTSNATYYNTTNMWDIEKINNVSFDNEKLIDGEAFTIMFLYERPSLERTNVYEEFVSFRTDANGLLQGDIIIGRRDTNYDVIEVLAGGVKWHFYNVMRSDITAHFTFVLVPYVGFKFYKNGIEQLVNWVNGKNVSGFPAKIYNIQNIGGTNSKVNGLLGNFRFYNRELSSEEILSIDSIGKTSNDLVPFEIISSYFSETNVYNFIGKNTNQNELLT